MATAAPSDATAKAFKASAERRNSDFAPAAFKKSKKGTTREGPDGVFTVGYGSGGIEEMCDSSPLTIRWCSGHSLTSRSDAENLRA